MIVVEAWKGHFVCGWSGPSILSHLGRIGIVESMCEALRGSGDSPEILAMNKEVMDEETAFRFFENRAMPIGRFNVIIVGDKFCPHTRMYLGSKAMFQEMYRDSVRKYWVAN